MNANIMVNRWTDYRTLAYRLQESRALPTELSRPHATPKRKVGLRLIERKYILNRWAEHTGDLLKDHKGEKLQKDVQMDGPSILKV